MRLKLVLCATFVLLCALCIIGCSAHLEKSPSNFSAAIDTSTDYTDSPHQEGHSGSNNEVASDSSLQDELSNTDTVTSSHLVTRTYPITLFDLEQDSVAGLVRLHDSAFIDKMTIRSGDAAAKFIIDEKTIERVYTALKAITITGESTAKPLDQAQIVVEFFAPNDESVVSFAFENGCYSSQGTCFTIEGASELFDIIYS